MAECKKCGGTIKLGFSDCTCKITVDSDHNFHKLKKPPPLENEIRAECQALADFLVEKNRAYGNSASEPCRIFAKRVDPLAQIDCRIDDKLSRLMKGCEFPGDNDIKDLAGYLVLRMIVEKQQKAEGEK